jgi:uncharacterized protein YegP (UPF0339 family)
LHWSKWDDIITKIRKAAVFVDNFSLQKTPKGYTFALHSANGQTVAVSEVYATEAACRRGIQSVWMNADAPVEYQSGEENKLPNPKFQLYRDKRGAYRFRLKARNGRIIAVSQAYRSKAACLEGIESVRIHAKSLAQEETT